MYHDIDRIALPCNVVKIFNAFVFLKIKCGAKRRPSLTAKRKLQITNAIQVYGTCDLLLVIRFLSYSEDEYAVFMRTNGYTELSNILKENKWYDKLDRAKLYFDCYNNKNKKAI